MFIEIILKAKCPTCNKVHKSIIYETTIKHKRLHIPKVLSPKISELFLKPHYPETYYFNCCNLHFLFEDIQIYGNGEIITDTEIMFNPDLWDTHSDSMETSVSSRLNQIVKKKLM